MDDFTAELMVLAYRTMRARQRDKTVPVRVSDLEEEIGRHWVIFRKGWIAQEAARLLRRARPERLADLVDCLWQLLAQHGEYWEYPDWDWEDPQARGAQGPGCPFDHDALLECAEWSAWAIAALRWLRVGPAPQFTSAELLDWLSGQQFTQLTLL